MKEIENERNVYESLYMDQQHYNSLPLFYELKKFQKNDEEIIAMDFESLSEVNLNLLK